MAASSGSGGTVANLQVVVGADVAAALLGFATLQGVISGLVDQVKQFIVNGLEMNSFLESSELQFKTLTGSAKAAHEQVGMLFDLAAHTPFTFESVTVASRQLEVFGGAALDTRDNLVMLGDAAAATSAPIEQVTFWTGRLYSALQAGEPIGMATMWLQRMGVLSAEATLRMKELSDQGASADAVWGAFSESMQRFSGAMKEQEGTWKGLTSTMSDTLTLLEGATTKGLFTNLEGQIKGLNAALASPQTAQQAFVVGEGLTALSGAAEWLGTTLANTAPAFNVAAAALDAMTDAEKRNYAASLQMTGAGASIASVMEAGSVEIAKAPPIIDQVRDSWEQAEEAANRAALAVGGYRDETYRAAAAQQILNQQLQDAREAAAAGAEDMFTRHPNIDMDVATGGNLSGIDAIMKKQQEAAAAAEKLARETAQAQAQAARDAEAAQRDAARQAEQAARTAAHQTEQAWTAAHKAVADSAKQSATAQIAAVQSVVDTTVAMQAQMQASYGNPSGGLLQDTGSQSGRTQIYGRTLVHPQYIFHFNGNVTTTQGDFQQSVVDAVQQADRQNALKLTRYATR